MFHSKKALGITPLFILLLILYLPSLQAKGPECDQVRAGLDLGSGTTKLLVALVDTCEQKIEETYLDTSVPFSYQEDLERNLKKGAGPILSERIQDEGIKVIKGLQQQAKNYPSAQWLAVATATFRAAKNSADYVQKIDRELKIKVHVLTQEEEAKLGAVSAWSQIETSRPPLKDLVFWDIGGGSMQISTMRGTGDEEWEIYQGKLASVSFKNLVVEAIQGHNLESHPSPNPLGRDAADRALKLAGHYARLHLPLPLLDLIKGKRVLGIGGVHYHSIGGQTGTKGKAYTQGDLEKAIMQRISLTDRQIGSEYAATEVTNLILVLGFMKEMKVTEVNSLKAGLLHGALVNGGGKGL